MMKFLDKIIKWLTAVEYRYTRDVDWSKANWNDQPFVWCIRRQPFWHGIPVCASRVYLTELSFANCCGTLANCRHETVKQVEQKYLDIADEALGKDNGSVIK